MIIKSKFGKIKWLKRAPFGSKCSKIRCRLGLRPRPRLGLTTLPRAPSHCRLCPSSPNPLKYALRTYGSHKIEILICTITLPKMRRIHCLKSMKCHIFSAWGQTSDQGLSLDPTGGTAPRLPNSSFLCS